jgi:release factor glutamine methyltransferase
MTTFAQLVAEAATRLAPMSDSPRLDAELLLAHALGVDRNRLLFDLGDDRPVPAGFEALLARRLAHEPIAYILSERDFWTLTLAVGPGVLIPRPDSETLVEAAIAHFKDQAPSRILDLGTGSGALLLACLDHWLQATGLGIDASAVALDYARANAGRNGLADRVEFRLGDWCAGLDARFDLILCNPPYVEADAELAPQVKAYEPASALFAGTEGLDDYRRLIPQLPARLAPGGIAVLELGAGQAPAVAAIARQAGMGSWTRKDLGGHERALVLFTCIDGAIG